MIFIGVMIEETVCLGERGEMAYFAAKDRLEFWKLFCRRKMFDCMIFSEYRELSRMQAAKHFSETYFSNALKWIENDMRDVWKMDIACYFLGTAEPPPAAG